MKTMPRMGDLNAEECALSAVLLHDQTDVFALVSPEAFWYEHTRAFFAAAQTVHLQGMPTVATCVLYELRDELDRITWDGLIGEALLLDMLSRRMLDVQAFMGPAMARIVNAYAARREALNAAQEEARRVMVTAVTSSLERTPALGFID